ncbi:flagellar hook-associated protein FlgL [Planktotalea sp.]|uniref:flagellar hook-associated protein FlgL n=1 Tax=Planktotalea sp. TaxID=2029877 RepID=UPI003F6BA4C7
MSISTKLFSDRMLTRFADLNDEIQVRQTKISTGQAIIEASESPLAAVELSALEERVSQLDGFKRNVGLAQDRLVLSDTTLSDVDTILSRLREQAITASSSTANVSDLNAIEIEVAQMFDAMVDLANTRTSNGQALFGGYATDGLPFQEGKDGRIVYHGDGGSHTLAASETMRLPTSVNGSEVFMQVQTEAGSQGMFDIIDSFGVALATELTTISGITTEGDKNLTLSVNSDREPRDWTFDLSGPDGAVTIVAKDVVDGSTQRMLEAINAQTQNTGVFAMEVDGQLELRSSTGGIELSNLEVEGVDLAMRQPKFTLSVGEDPIEILVPKSQRLEAQIEKIVAAGESIAVSRTTVGARMVRAETQERTLETRSLSLELKVDELASADLEKLITEMQTLMLTQNVARQAYSQIGQRTLFDYLK